MRDPAESVDDFWCGACIDRRGVGLEERGARSGAQAAGGGVDGHVTLRDFEDLELRGDYMKIQGA